MEFILFIILPIAIYSIWAIYRSGRKLRLKEKARKFIEDLPSHVVKDWNANTSSWKITSQGNTSGILAIYKFDNGITISLHKVGYRKEILYTDKRYKSTHEVRNYHWNRIVEILNKVIDANNGTSREYRDNKYRSGGKTTKSKPKTTNPNHSHPKWYRYWTLVTTIRERTANLDKMSKTDPNRSSAINELNSAKRRGKAMKDKYKF